MSNSNYQMVSTLLQEISSAAVAKELSKKWGQRLRPVVGYGRQGLYYGALTGLVYSIVDRFSDLRGEDKKELAQSVANYIKKYNLDINKLHDKAIILNFIRIETSRIKNVRMVKQTGIGAGIGASIGLARGLVT